MTPDVVLRLVHAANGSRHKVQRTLPAETLVDGLPRALSFIQAQEEQIWATEDCKQYPGETTYILLVNISHQYLGFVQFVWVSILLADIDYGSGSFDCSEVVQNIHTRKTDVNQGFVT